MIDQDDQNKKTPKLATEEVQEKFAEKMEEINVQERERLAQARAFDLGYPYLDLAHFPINLEALDLIPEKTAKELKVVCFFKTEHELRVGAVRPDQPAIENILKGLEEKEGAKGGIYLISEHSFNRAFGFYKKIIKPRKVAAGVEITEADLNRFEGKLKSFRDLAQKIKGLSLTDLVVIILAGAIQSRSSDIHLEAGDKEVKVRYRIDGILQTAAVLEKELWPKLVNRIKVIAKLKINVADRPQDGHFTILLSSDRIEIRVSCLPTAHGESVVMRLLRSAAAGLELDDLGLRGQAFEQLKKEIKKPNGMIITTGPTGSGKTTTLYSIMKQLNNSQTKIITLEDPIEYRLAGINQSQVDSSHGYTFSSGLRAIVRQDPNVIMVGEIRDLETADIAINAALTGHLVISTIHTNSAAATIPRFLSMGIKPFLLAPALNAIIAQRLVRRICQKCKKEAKIDKGQLEQIKEILSKIPPKERVKLDLSKPLKFYEGAGCPACQNLGYLGRVGLYEILLMDKKIENEILSGQVSEFKLQEMAEAQGMVTMVQDGLLRALEGITSVAEVFRVAE